jgi:type I restriction enzyme S subunit
MEHIDIPLPPGWAWTTLGEISDVNPGKAALRELADDLEVTFVPMAAVDETSGAITQTQTRSLGEVRKGYTYFANDDVIFAKITPCMENGKAAIARNLMNGIALGSTEFHVLRAHEGVLPEWIYYYVRQESYRNAASSNFAGTAGQLRVPSTFITATEIPLAPLPEQRRIVARIEELLTRLDAGVAALKRAQANLKRYKASVLKAACEGRLVPTEAELARAEGRTYEPASELLQRILVERRAKREADLRAQGKNTGKAKHEEPQLLDFDNLLDLPEGWHWATLDQLGQEGRPIIYGIIKPGPHVPEGIPYVRVTEMKDGRIDLEHLRRTSPERAAKFARATLAVGDLLISKDGTIGRVAVVPPQLAGGNITQHVMRAPIHHFVDRDYVVHAIRSPLCQHWLTGETRGVALRGVNVEDFRRLPIPVAPAAEQKRITTELEQRMSVVEEIEASIDVNVARAERMRQSILKRAFSGKLVPQDPNDEPAGALLERLRAAL